MSDSVKPDEVIPPGGGAGLQARNLARDAVLMLPNLVKLLGRLLKDPRVPRRSKLVMGAALAYVVSPVDLIPEIIPVAGVIDDVFVVAFSLNHLIKRAGEEVVLEHWDGPQDLLSLIRSVLDTVSDLVPARIRRTMGRLAGE
ncbi:MAG TPA: YkvA family protein [Acidimicrobiia bacterium]|nr:YkvA family protein [Acidimicrobiia bacterium]